MLEVKKVRKKRILVTILVIFVVLIIVAALGIMIYVKLDDVDYGTMLVTYANEDMVAEFDGVRTQLTGSNKDYLYSVLDVTERVRLWQAPEIPENAEIVTIIYGDNKLVVEVIQPDPKVDLSYVHQQQGLHNRWVSIAGYRIFERTLWTIRPEGYYSENILLE